MSRRVRTGVFLVAAGCVAALLLAAFFRMPAFGGAEHLYRDLAVHAAVLHGTANVVASVMFDQRALDTLGEETILLGSVMGVTTLLRPAQEETERRPPAPGHTPEATRLVGCLLLPVTLLIGLDVILHGHLTPGGGFQGGVVLATGLHLQYLTGSYRALDRLRPLRLYDTGEALGALAFVVVGLAGLAATGAFLANVLPAGGRGQLLSAGTVPVLNIAVGLEVGCAVVVLLAQFFTEDFLVSARGSARGPTGQAGNS